MRKQECWPVKCLQGDGANCAYNLLSLNNACPAQSGSPCFRANCMLGGFIWHAESAIHLTYVESSRNRLLLMEFHTAGVNETDMALNAGKHLQRHARTHTHTHTRTRTRTRAHTHTHICTRSHSMHTHTHTHTRAHTHTNTHIYTITLNAHAHTYIHRYTGSHSIHTLAHTHRHQ